jgi:hypothetical protein
MIWVILSTVLNVAKRLIYIDRLAERQRNHFLLINNGVATNGSV